jgi:hypothetical protein
MIMGIECWVYAKSEEQAINRAMGIGLYEPWDSRVSAKKNGPEDDDEELYRVVITAKLDE